MIVLKKFIPSSFDAVDSAVHSIETFLEMECPAIGEHDVFRIKFMIREMLNNGVEHGNHFDPEKKVGCILHADPPNLTFDFYDEGPGVEVDETIIPDAKESPLRERHRGYQTILEMGFNIQINRDYIRVTYVTGKEAN